MGPVNDRLWHKADIPVPSVDVRFRGQTGRDMPVLSLSAFGPKADIEGVSWKTRM